MMKVLLCLITLLLSRGEAGAFLRNFRSAQNISEFPSTRSTLPHDLNSFGKHLVARGPRLKCNPPEFASEVVRKRSEQHVEATLARNGTLQPRMKLPAEDEDMEDFMNDEVGNAESVVWELPDGRDSDGEEQFQDVNTSVLREFRDFADEELSLSAQQLKGCTMLAIISRRGVYLSHWWETISFNPDFPDTEEERQRSAVSKKRRLDKIFHNTVIRPIERGVRKRGDSIQVSLRNNAIHIQDEYLRAYLVHPSTHSKEDESDETEGYREEWDKIKAAVLQILPQLDGTDRWQEVAYEVVPSEAQFLLRDTARGKLLFKYDPSHRIENGRSMRRAMLWSEDKEIHSDEWQG